MTNEQFRKHKHLKEYRNLMEARDNMIIDYCSLLTKLTKVTQNISPMPGGGNADHYDEDVFDLAYKFLLIQDVDVRIRRLVKHVQKLPLKERFVIQLYYFNGVKLEDIAKIIGKSIRTTKNYKASGLELLDI